MRMLVKHLKKLSIFQKSLALIRLYGLGSSWRQSSLYAWGKSVLGISLGVSLFTLGVRQVGILEPAELRAFDQMIRWRGEQDIDPRFLIVKITEEDIRQYNFPLSDQVLYQLLNTLEQYDPVVIGLDIFRDLKVEPGSAQLSQKFANSDRIVAICKSSDNNGGSAGDSNDGSVPPPQDIPPEQVGFNDTPRDNDGMMRRGLLILEPSDDEPCQAKFAFSLQLALQYLAKRHQIIPEDGFKLGQVVFQPLSPHTGGYQHADVAGFQILINYRSSRAGSETLTVQDILSNNFDPALIQDKIVLIGSTAPSLKDRFFTPYSASKGKMAGVYIHGQLTSQIIDAALGERPLFWFWSEWQEVLWILGWSVTGGWIAYKIRHPLPLILGGGVSLGLLLGTTYGILLQTGWVPIIAPAMGLVGSGIGVMAYSSYQDKQLKEALAREKVTLLQEKDEIINRAEQQNMDLQQLQILVEEYKKKNVLDSEKTQEQDKTSLPENEIPTMIAPQATTWKTGVGSTLRNHYKLEQILGSGGFGYTYLAEDVKHPHAPKCVVKHLQPACRDTRVMEISRRLFRTEAEILDKLGNHPQIPYLLDHFEEDEEFYLVEEYIPGHLLTEELQPDQHLDQHLVVNLLQELLSVLTYLHEHHVIHRDVKPSNIIRAQPDNRLVLIDFGAVKQIQTQNVPDKAPMTVAIGTRGYASPEQLAGQPNITSDLYALGMIAIKGLTGISPDQLSVDPHKGHFLWRQYSLAQEELADILDKMVSPYLGERYRSGIEILEALENLS